ncbi:uncharacterized protein NECHADRAFT_105872 [Fusarium vanettenii 77-13-4]|uniref:Uncharacterized protein n=1 Tax=Fusarium vanettenii (strain ATCC MYA-4622 / CBS 123669 / FGSC 9596 / NRRL 45880 / 77-13-4) TaxID=660122 RepID=C7Z5P2_FUSV7|nr:uncharacterized protein NECHADRAFT_105872 [Fusarium vanettenii 77-13-4]EEU40560.1 hypothetical protein NECHADRAFT_105872 [Fusarium vanettenii 77-13-4]
MIMRSVLAALASAMATTQVLAASNDAATPEDVLSSMRAVDKLSADTHSHAREIGTYFNRKHFILGACVSVGDTYLSCRATIEGVEKINDEFEAKPRTPFDDRGQKEICSAFHWFEYRQFLLVVTLINEPRSIESGGFDDYFEDCFTRLIDYAPSCRDKIIENNGQLERAFDDAIKKIKARWGARRAMPVDIPVPLD